MHLDQTRHGESAVLHRCAGLKGGRHGPSPKRRGCLDRSRIGYCLPGMCATVCCTISRSGHAAGRREGTSFLRAIWGVLSVGCGAWRQDPVRRQLKVGQCGRSQQVVRQNAAHGAVALGAGLTVGLDFVVLQIDDPHLSDPHPAYSGSLVSWSYFNEESETSIKRSMSSGCGRRGLLSKRLFDHSSIPPFHRSPGRSRISRSETVRAASAGRHS